MDTENTPLYPRTQVQDVYVYSIMFIRDGEKFMISTPDRGPNTGGCGKHTSRLALIHNTIRQRKIKFKIKLTTKLK